MIFSKLIAACLIIASQSFADTYEAFVNNNTSDTISVISLPSGAVQSSIPVGASPYFVATTPDMSTAFVTNLSDSTVTAINVTTHTVFATIPVGATPYYLAITPNGKRVYVANYGDNTVSVIDTSTYTVIATIDVGTGPYGIIATPSGNKIYVVNYSGSTVSVINVATNTVIATIPVGDSPYLPAVTPNGAYVYVPNYDDGTLSVIDTATDTILTTLTTAGGYAQTVFVTPDGTKAYVPCYYDDFIYIVNTASNTSEGTITVGSNPYSVAFSANSQTAYVGNYGSSSISVIDVLAATVTSTLLTPTLPSDLRLTPDTTEVGVAYANNPGSFDLISTATDLVVATAALENTGAISIAYGLVSTTQPVNLTGVQGKNKFATQTDTFNQLNWEKPAGINPVFYYVYRGAKLIATLPGTELSYLDHNRKPGKTYTYYVASVDFLGTLSAGVSVVVKPK